MAEWLKAHAWKACKQETVSGVRIPSSPHFLSNLDLVKFLESNNCLFHVSRVKKDMETGYVEIRKILKKRTGINGFFYVNCIKKSK